MAVPLTWSRSPPRPVLMARRDVIGMLMLVPIPMPIPMPMLMDSEAALARPAARRAAEILMMTEWRRINQIFHE